MTIQIIATDTVISADPIALYGDSLLIVGKGRSLVSTDGVGVTGINGHGDITVLGSLTTALDSINLTLSYATSIYVGQEGSIASGHDALSIDGEGTRLINHGEIFATGTAVNFNTATYPPFHGQLPFSIRNFGSITGAVAIDVSSLPIDIYNAGTITSFGPVAIRTGIAGNTFKNVGQVIGNIAFGTGPATFVNRGIIEGSVTFGGGNNYGNYADDRGGTVSGSIRFGDGDNTFIPGASEETVYGGAGVDLLDLRHSGAAVIALDQSIASDGSTAGDRFLAFENVLGSSGSDVIIGNAANNALSGFGGNDQLSGQAGNDSMVGGNGNDRLEGGAGNDTLYGDAGTDVLVGGAGTDHLNGGTDADVFIFDATSLGTDPALADSIMDFSKLQSDRINLALIDADTTTRGNGAFTFIGTSAFHDVAGELRYELVAGKVNILGDTNGDGVADLIIHTNNVAFVGGDFIL